MNQTKTSIVYFGTPEFSAFALDKIIQILKNDPDYSKFTIKAVVTNPDAPIGRKQIITSSPVAKIAEEYSIPLLKPEKFTPEYIEKHKEYLQADLYLIFSYGKILPEDLVSLPQLGAVNIHGSLLPKYRGTAPIQAAIFNGDKESGVTLMKIDEKMDHGPLIASQKFELEPTDTFDTAARKVAEIGANLFIEILPSYSQGTIELTPQDENNASYTWKKSEIKDAAYFDIQDPPTPIKIDQRARAFYPWPNAWTKWNDKIVKFLPDKLIQMEGKNPSDLKSFLNGYPDFPIKEL